MFTKKHFKEVAEIVSTIAWDHRVPVAEKFSKFFVADNPRFDKFRFFVACRIKECAQDNGALCPYDDCSNCGSCVYHGEACGGGNAKV